MRSTSVAACIVAVGVLASLPFRRTEPAIDPDAPVGLASGPLASQFRQESITGVMQWPERPGFDPSLAWQPQPMRFETVAPAIEMPPMPDAFTLESIELPIPEPIRERFNAVSAMRSSEATKSPGFQLPPEPPIEDNFAYTPNPSRPSFTPGSIQSASVISNERVISDAPAERQYIREPK